MATKKRLKRPFSLPNLTFTCSCKSRKAPCRHLLGLLLLWQQFAENFSQQQPSPHITAWIKREQIKCQRAAKANGRLPQNQPSPQKLNQLQAGLNELELWLLDMVRHGLASLPERPKSYWETMAHRLIDTQAPALAAQVRNLAKVPTAQSNWTETYLQQIGRLYLIIQGAKNFEQLPAITQADLQTAVGWLPQISQNPTIISDNWLVLGRQQEIVGSQTRYITWLWGQEIQRTIQFIDVLPSGKLASSCLPTNTTWHGQLCLAPGNWPLIATRYEALQPCQTAVHPDGFKTIQEATKTYSHALAVNPWLPHFPMLLHNTQPSQTETGWQLIDQMGSCLPLPEKFAYGWHLTTLAGGTPSPILFGIWNGRFLQPLSVQHNNRWQDIHIWRGVR